jgi:PKD repeat protein
VANWWLLPSDYPINYTLKIRTSDFVVVGHSNSFGPMNAFIANLSSGGQLRWAKLLSPPGSATSHGLSLIETQDNEFVMTGAIWDHPDGEGMDLFIAKFNDDGSYQWGKILDGCGDECGSSVIEDSSGNLIVTGWTTSFGTMDVLLAKFKSTGNLEWAKAWGGSGNEYGESIAKHPWWEDLLVAGATDSFGAGGDDFLLAKFDTDGTFEWAKTLGGNNDDYGRSLTWTCCGGSHIPSGDGTGYGIAVTGATKSYGQGGLDLLVAMFGLDGSYQWARTLSPSDPGTSDDSGFSIINVCYPYTITRGSFSWTVPMNCKLAVTGVTSSWGTGGQDVLFATMDYYGYTACEQIAAADSDDIFLSQTGDTTDFTTADIGGTNSISFTVQSIDPAVTPICTTFGQATDIGPVDQPVLFKFAIITDIHIHEPELEKVVDWINEAINDGGDIRFVMVLGDISDEGSRCRSEPYIKVKTVLDKLQVPYIPVIGNHDVWYNHPEDMSENWFEKCQEEIFNQIFSPEYDYLGNCVLPNWDKASIPVQHQPPNAPGPIWSYFQNFAFDYMGDHFICLDWNSRNDIYTSDVSGWNRGLPDLHQSVTGGTWEWFEDHLGSYPNMGDENVLLFAHHPLSFVASQSQLFSYFFTFNENQYDDIVQTHLDPYENHLDKWFAGHWHVCDGMMQLCCEENITNDLINNDPTVGNPILTNIETRSVTSYPIPPGENIRLVRVHDALKVDFDYSPSQPTVNTLITFLDQSATTSGTITTWDWDFGDGTHSGIQNPTYNRYTEPGIYKVTLTVTTNTGLTGSIAKAIDVGTKQLTSDYPDATAYNNARRLIYDNGVLHLIYRWSPADWEAGLAYANSTDQGRTWFEVTRSTLTGGDYPGGPLMGLYPALGVDTSGKPYIVKERTGGLGIPVFDAARREKPLGWFSYDRVIESGSFGHPSVVVDSDNTLHIAISYDDGTSSKIRYYKGYPGGLIRIDNILDYEVIPAAGSGECQFASIAIDSSGIPHVIWQQGSEIYHSYRQGTPTPWSNPEQISSGNAQTPSLVADGSVLHAVWQEGDKVVYKKYDGGWPTTPTTVSTLSAGTIESYPQVGSRDGLICVVWADIAGGNYEIFYSWTVTGSWSPPENLSGTPAKSQYPQAAICSVSPNELCVVWTEGNGPTYDIRSKCF